MLPTLGGDHVTAVLHGAFAPTMNCLDSPGRTVVLAGATDTTTGSITV